MEGLNIPSAVIFISSESSSNIFLILQGQCAYCIKNYFLGRCCPRLEQKEELFLGCLTLEDGPKCLSRKLLIYAA